MSTNANMTSEQQALGLVAGQQIVRIARALMGDDLDLVSAAIVGALGMVIASAKDPGAALDAALRVLDESRPVILKLHGRIYAGLAASGAAADVHGRGW